MSDSDFLEITKVLVPFAKQMLAKQGGFSPFGAAVDSNGKVGLWSADLGPENSNSAALVEQILGVFRVQATQGVIRAIGVCFNVGARLPSYSDKVDAVCCQLEDADGSAKQLFVAYRKGFLGGMKFDKPVTLEVKGSVFGQPSTPG